MQRLTTHSGRNTESSLLPITQKLTAVYTLSLLIASLVLVASVLGLIYQNTLYPTAALRANLVPNDVVNLVIGLPMLLGAMILTKRGRLAGLLCWPGALLYGLYNYTAYVFGIPFGGLTILNVAIVLLSGAAIFLLLQRVDQGVIYERLAGTVPVKSAAILLLFFGLVFFFRAIGLLLEPLSGQMTLPTSELGVLIADLVVSVAWVAGGVLLFRQRPWGYVTALGLLFAASMLFVALILVLLLRPMLTPMPFDFGELFVILVMALICFVPSGLFLRGVWQQG